MHLINSTAALVKLRDRSHNDANHGYSRLTPLFQAMQSYSIKTLRQSTAVLTSFSLQRFVLNLKNCLDLEKFRI